MYRFFSAILIITSIVSYAPLVSAQGTGSAPSPSATERPNVTPPTPPPSELLPPAPLVEEETETAPIAAVSSEAEESETAPIEPINPPTWLFAFVGLALLLIGGFVWHVHRRGKMSHLTETFRR